MLRLLGTIEAGPVSGSTQLVTAPRLRVILALLGAHPGQRVSIDRLVDALWPDEPPRSAEASIQVHISKIRRIFEPDLAPRAESSCLRHEPGAYVLALPRDELDITAFLDAAADAEATDSVSAADTALSLWNDPPFAEYVDEPWAISTATELRRVHLATAIGHYERALRDGRGRAVVDNVRADLGAHPYNEQLTGILMRVLYQDGDQTAALDVAAALRRRLLDELGLDPTPELRELEHQILNHEVETQPATSHPSRPPPVHDRGAIYGRNDDIEHVISALQTHRLVTLTGPGGVGKTRLAQAVGTVFDGSVFIDLSTASSTDEALTYIEDAFGVNGDPLTDRLTTLAGAASSTTSLLILDNCEQLPDDFSEAAGALVQAGTAHLLVTSQRSLKITAEHLVRVQPFEPAAGSVGEVATHPGLRMLTADGSITMTEANADALVELHNRLDGLPLALQLAAFRLRTVSIDEILSAPDDSSFSAPADLPERHRSLDVLVSSSIAALDERSLEVLEACSIFAGSVPLAAINQLMAKHADPVEVGIAVADLVDRSLLTMSTNGPVRYRMLDTIRQHCRQRLDTAGRANELERRHAGLVRRAAIDHVTTPHPALRLDSVGDEVLAALDRIERSPGDPARDIALATSVATAWYGAGRVGEARDRLRRVLRIHHAADPLSVGHASALLGMVSFDHGAFNELARFTGDALRILEPIDARNLHIVRAGHHFGLGELDRTREAILSCLADDWTVGRMRIAALEIAATSAWFMGDHESCADYFAEQHEVALELDDTSFAAHALRGQAMMRALSGSPEAGLVLARRADEFVVTDFKRPATEGRTATTVIRYLMGDLATARTEARAVLESSIRRFDAHAVALALPIAAACALADDDQRSVALLTGWFDGLCDATGFFAPASSQEIFDQTVEATRASMAPDDWTIARADGASFGLAAALNSVPT